MPIVEHTEMYKLILPLSLTTATDKVALLIGNMNYAHLTQLCAPMADVHELANQLRQLDFKVVSLLDLNWLEMNSAVTEFLLLLDRGVYGQSGCLFHPKRLTMNSVTLDKGDCNRVPLRLCMLAATLSCDSCPVY